LYFPPPGDFYFLSPEEFSLPFPASILIEQETIKSDINMHAITIIEIEIELFIVLPPQITLVKDKVLRSYVRLSSPMKV
jgi:hypothetical protein